MTVTFLSSISLKIKVDFSDKCKYFLRPARDIPKFVRPVIVRKLFIPHQDVKGTKVIFF